MTKTETASPIAAITSITGKGSQARKLAAMHIAVDSYFAENGRAKLVATLKLFLGASPSDALLSFAQQETTIGRVAHRLPAGEFPKGCTEPIDKLKFARELVLHYQAPTTAVAGKVPKLRKDKKGWRSAVQHRVIRNADENWSQVKADLGLGNATPDRDKKANQPPRMAGSTAMGKGAADSAKPAHGELVKPSAPLTADEVVQHVVTQAAALLQFSNKHAKLMPSELGAAVQAFKKAVNAAANNFGVTKAEADGKAAEKQKATA